MTKDASAYGWLMLAGIGVTVWLWIRLARRDTRLLAIYVGGLLGAFLGAKLLYLLIDGWRVVGQPDAWRQLATGKTILGALIGGYLAVDAGGAALHDIEALLPAGSGAAS